MKNKGLTLTIIAEMTSNYGEGLGNIASVQRVYKDGKVYATRSRESLKNAIMEKSGMYDDLQVEVDGATQKKVDKDINASNCRALEGGYMNTGGNSKDKVTRIRKSSFYLTDAVACEEFINETRFHNNLHLASTFAKHNKINLQKDAGKAGLMPYQYEYDKSLKKYSITFDLDKVGVDENFDASSTNEEKVFRVNSILSAVEQLCLVVKGNLDNAEPLFIVGGIGERKTHYFDNVVEVSKSRIVLNSDLKERVKDGYRISVLNNNSIVNIDEVKEKFDAVSMTSFFDKLRKDVENYYGSN